MREANPRAIYLRDYTPPEYLIRSVDLHFDLDEQQTRVISRLTMARNPDSKGKDASLVLDGEGLTLLSVALDGDDLAAGQYQQGPETLTIAEVPQDREFVVSIENHISPRANIALEGLFVSKGMLCTQCEAEGFRKITFYLDRPDVMARFRVTLTGDRDRYPVLLSNGNRVEQVELSGDRHQVTWEDPFAKPSYLFALVAGRLECIEDSFTTLSGRQVALRIFVEAPDLDKCDHAMQSLKHAMQWDEQVYGREYDLDIYMIVAVGHFNMGAMENKGLNIFNTKYVLARPDTATDLDYEYIEGVIAHEYFHNWTGNRITCRDWFQLSLKEGLTVFRDQEFTADRTSRAVKRIEDVNMLRTRQFAEDAGPMAHPVRPESYIEINNFYTLTVYEKGAEIVRMLHTLLGAAGFRKGADLYFQRHDGQAVTCDDFVRAMEDANDVDLRQFRRWYSQAGTPVVGVEQYYDRDAQCLTLTFRQSCPPTPGQPVKQPLHIPIRLGLLGKQGEVVPLHVPGVADGCEELVLELRSAQQSFTFEGLPEQPRISLLRGFSAPVKLDQERSLQELAFLSRHDPDPFNRWEGGQQLAGNIILNLVEDIRNGRELQLNPLLVQAWQSILEEPWEDLSYFSLLLKLPAEGYLGEQMAVIDVEAIHQARKFVKKGLAAALQEQFRRLYRTYHLDESGRFDSAAIGRRRIKNTCLDYLLELESDDVRQWAERQFYDSGNMTDQVAALEVIINSQHPAKQQCLEQFYRQWQDDDLVIDKWFALQAGSDQPDTLKTVRSLLQHPAFDLHNPNRVRALIGAFAQANPVNFHAADGEGYRFLADHVIALNAINPQVAARLCGALARWRRYDAGRRKLMQAQLQRIVDTPDLSRDVYEVVSKSLA